jgi:hypothetical protein
MPEDLRDVKPEEASTSEQVVETPVETTPQEQAEQQTEIPSETAEVKDTGEVDERGVPWKNVAHEALRKITELQTNLPNILKSVLQETQGQTPTQPQYTKAQLRAFAEQTQEPTQKVWALEEIDKLERTERQTEMKQLFEGYTKQTQESNQRGQSVQFVAQNFPEIIIKDEMGNFAGFNNNHPLTQRINEYMSNPALAQNPQGLVAAAKMAAFDLGVSMNRKLTNKINTTTAQLRKEQKKQLISGGGSPIIQETGKTRIAKLAEQYQKTGDKNIFKELVKARGLIPQG